MVRKTIPNKAPVLTKAVIKVSNNASSVWLPVRAPELGVAERVETQISILKSPMHFNRTPGTLGQPQAEHSVDSWTPAAPHLYEDR